mgnify:CR=1 FL=1
MYIRNLPFRVIVPVCYQMRLNVVFRAYSTIKKTNYTVKTGLNQRSPAEGKGKAQKLLAQGIALGIIAINKTPCKGKSFVYCLVL